jgi:2-polyprenyl-3-methyl-5-hydroxy-6-metoxy-1,4-benzoquinol methylase
MREIYKFLIKSALRLHNLSYKLAAKLAIKTESRIHPKHRLTNYHQFFVDNIKEGDRVLDIGCGNGALTFDLAQKAKEVIGIDLSYENIKIAKENYSAPNIEYIIGDAIKYNFNQRFDVVVLSNILEHIENRVKFLQKIKTLAPKILIRVPMINRDWITLYKKELGVEYRLDNTHFIEYTLETLKEELAKADLNLEEYLIRFGEIWTVAFPK